MNISSDLSVLNFINSLGGTITADRQIRLPSESHQALAQRPQVSILGQYGLIAFSGPDSHKFLQGQTTCNVQEIRHDKSSPGACCTPKGRMFCNFQLALDHQDQYWMRTRHDVLESTLKTLNKYLALFRGSKAHNCLDSHVVIGLWGAQADVLIAQIFGQCPTETHSSLSHEAGLIVCIDAPSNRFELWLSIDQTTTIWPTLQDNCTVMSNDAWRLTNILAGVGDVQAATQEEFVPQMLNLQALQGISFKKGCYTGQEIVARMHYLGKLKKRMYPAKCEPLIPSPDAGTELFALNEISGSLQAIGHVVDSVTIEDTCHLLVVIPDELIEKDKPISVGENGPILTILPMPYALTV